MGNRSATIHMSYIRRMCSIVRLSVLNILKRSGTANSVRTNQRTPLWACIISVSASGVNGTEVVTEVKDQYEIQTRNNSDSETTRENTVSQNILNYLCPL